MHHAVVRSSFGEISSTVWITYEFDVKLNLAKS